jgi:hypothetical protein
MELLHEELDEDDVQPDTDDHQYKISEKLHPSMQRTAGEDDISIEEKPRGKAYAKCNDDRGDIRRDRPGTQMDIVLVQDIVITEPIHHDIQQRGSTAASRIPEGLQRHEPAERRVKKINKIDNPLLYHRVVLLSFKDNYKM